jgi:hypothetical protein
MNQKIKLTEYLLDELGLADGDKKTLKKYLNTWWYNTRKKETGGLRLTTEGFEALTQSGFKSHKVRFDDPIEYTNQLIIQLDHFIDCPWYITPKFIYVFNDKMAVQLVLFSGNIARFGQAKAESLKS